MRRSLGKAVQGQGSDTLLEARAGGPYVRLPRGTFHILSSCKPLLNENNSDILLHLFSLLVTQNQTEKTKMDNLSAFQNI